MILFPMFKGTEKASFVRFVVYFGFDKGPEILTFVDTLLLSPNKT